jgi:hypothetical protein
MAHRTIFVANVNFDDNGQLKVNVNSVLERQRLERQVSASYRRPETINVSPPFIWRSFLFQSFFPTTKHFANFSNCSERAEYFLSCMHLFSQAICRKNLTPSSLEIAIIRRGILVSGGRYIEIKMFSKRPRNNLLFFHLKYNDALLENHYIF